VFAKKFNRDSRVIGYKAYLVGKGYSQKFSINFLWTSVAVICLETVCTALVLTAILNLEL
ncbi:hypothetical protein HETIRDRAFT_317933, partial [Heterobasidion irregulare TC 32-1]